MDRSYIERLYTLLQQSTAPDTNLIKAATASLNKDFYRSPECIPGLFEILASSPEQSIRQIAAVELRKRVSQKDGALWTQAPQAVRETVKSKSLEIVLAEQVPIVRHAISRVIAAIAEIELSASTWPALLPWLNETTSSTNVIHREIGIYVLFTSLEAIIDANPTSLSQFIQHLSTLIQDPASLEVRSTTLRSLGTLSQYIEPSNKSEIALFQSLIPSMVAVIASALEENAPDPVRHGIDVFETLLILETPLLAKHIPQLVEFFTNVGANRSLEGDNRVMALNALTWIIKYKKNKVQSLNLAKPILEALLLIGAEEEPEDLEEDAPARTAYRAVDALATTLPPTQVFPPLMVLVEQYIQSPDPNLRKSALTSFGLAVEGCSEFIRPHIRKMWPLIDQGFQDPVAIVRNAACVAFGCLCEWLPEESAERHEIVMPALMNLIDNTESQSAACTALDAFLEVLGSKIAQYITLIMERLSGLLETAPLHTKALVTGAIGSAAHASGPDFKPYFAPTLARLRPFFTLTAEGEEQELRGIAMDALGTMAEAIGKDDFRPFLSDAMTMALGGANLGSARLKECSFLLYGVLARLFEGEFAVYLPTIVPALIESCQQIESGEDTTGFSNSIINALNASAGEGFNAGTGDSASNAIPVADLDVDVEDLEDERALAVNSAIAVEKEIAADTLGSVFAAVGEPFLPYLETATRELIRLLDHYYEGIRKSACSSLLEFLHAFYVLSNPEQWQPGIPAVIPLHDKVKEFVEMIIPPLLNMWENEDDKSVAANLCQGLADTMTKLGPGFIEGHLNEICTYTIQILERKALCQQDPDQDETEEPDEDQAEYESVLISSASDVVGALAAVLGPSFSTAFASFMPLLFKYYTKNRSVSDRSSSIGTLGEIITGLKGGVTKYTEPLLDHIVRAFDDPEPEVRSNAAFAAGSLIEMSEQDLTPQYLPILSHLQPFFVVQLDAPEPVLNARDNAAGAVGRMIVKNTPAVPLDQVLPVLIGALPLRKDYLENKAVFDAFFHLFRTNPPAITAFIDQLLPIFVEVLNPALPDQLGDATRAQLIALLGALNSQIPDKIAASGLNVFIS